MKKLGTLLLMLTVALVAGAQQTQDYNVSYTVKRIWGDGSRHLAFTSIEKYQGRYYVTFRDGFNHVFNEKGEADGIIKVISSPDGENWEEVATFKREGYDLRDPKLCTMPDGRLMLLVGCNLVKGTDLVSTRTMVAFSKDGRKFSKLGDIKIPGNENAKNNWLWRLTWHKGVGYGCSYREGNGKNVLEMVTTTDGKTYKVERDLDVPGYPNETTIRFMPDDKMIIIIRRDGPENSTYMLTAMPPYDKFESKDLGFHCGGPDFVVLPDGKIILAGRNIYVPYHARTSIYTGNLKGAFGESITLPSAGDNSYPGMLIEGDQLWMTYYSSHVTNKPSIFLVKFPLSFFRLR